MDVSDAFSGTIKKGYKLDYGVLYSSIMGIFCFYESSALDLQTRSRFDLHLATKDFVSKKKIQKRDFI